MNYQTKMSLVFSVCIFLAALTGCGAPSSGRIVYQPVIQQSLSFNSAVTNLQRAAISRDIISATGPFTPVRTITNIIVNENGTVRWELAPEMEWKDNVGPASGPGPSQAFNMSLLMPGLDFTVYEWGPSWEITLPDFMLVGHLNNLTKAADNLYVIRHTLENLTEKQNKSLLLFEPIAAEYRLLSVKPTITEDERRLIVQANESTQEKQYDLAIDLYNKIIERNPTSYPAAYFNLALLYEQQRYYTFAITSMKKYLMLVPEAPDARSAQDKIYGWELKTSK